VILKSVIKPRAPHAQLKAELFPSVYVDASTLTERFFSDYFLQKMTSQRHNSYQPLEPCSLISQVVQFPDPASPRD